MITDRSLRYGPQDWRPSCGRRSRGPNCCDLYAKVRLLLTWCRRVLI